MMSLREELNLNNQMSCSDISLRLAFIYEEADFRTTMDHRASLRTLQHKQSEIMNLIGTSLLLLLPPF